MIGQEYKTVGASKLTRRLEFVARMKIDGQEFLLFRPVRKVSKHRP